MRLRHRSGGNSPPNRWAIASGSAGAGPSAPDGSPVELFALLPPGPVPALISAAVRPGGDILDLGCGAGRMAGPLVALGHRVVGVDQSPDMLARAGGRATEVVLADIEGLDLGRRFDAVVLGSFLVNTPDDARRAAFLATCARHVRDDGTVLVQRLHPVLVPLAVDADSEEDGVVYSMTGVAHDGDLFSATMGFTVGGRHWEHPYLARVLGDEATEDALAAAGLRLDRWLDQGRTWLAARPVAAGAAAGPHAGPDAGPGGGGAR